MGSSLEGSRGQINDSAEDPHQTGVVAGVTRIVFMVIVMVHILSSATYITGYRSICYTSPGYTKTRSGSAKIHGGALFKLRSSRLYTGTDMGTLSMKCRFSSGRMSVLRFMH